MYCKENKEKENSDFYIEVMEESIAFFTDGRFEYRDEISFLKKAVNESSFKKLQFIFIDDIKKIISSIQENDLKLINAFQEDSEHALIHLISLRRNRKENEIKKKNRETFTSPFDCVCINFLETSFHNINDEFLINIFIEDNETKEYLKTELNINIRSEVDKIIRLYLISISLSIGKRIKPELYILSEINYKS